MTSTQVLYVGGWGRSGSTLLSHMLGHVDGYVSVGELRYLWQGGVAADELCGCGLPFSQCEFWTAVGDHAFGGWDAVDVNEVLELEAAVLRHRNVPALAAPGLFGAYADRLRRYSELTARVYAAIAEVSGARVVVDSTKNPPYAYFLRRVGGIDLRVVHLVRDSRGVVFSGMKKVVRPEITEGEALFEEFSPGRAAVRWTECNLAFELLRGLRTPTVRVRYESLAAAPPPQLQRVLDRLDPGTRDLEFLDAGEVEVGADQHSIRGNPMRFEHGRQRVRVDDAWRTQMRQGTRRLVTAVTWPLLLTYGYLRP
ncbi:MAG: sulfotransferase [Gaiellales bacterium]